MRDEVLEQLRKLNLTPPPPSWTGRWLDFLLDGWNALFGGMVLASVTGIIYLLTHQ
jgi:hypothetical protein